MGTLFESELWIENSQKGKNEKRGEEEESSHQGFLHFLTPKLQMQGNMPENN